MSNKSKLIQQHIEWLKQHNITATQEMLDRWSAIPYKYLKKFFEEDKHKGNAYEKTR
jgi:hypothetical protein